VLTYIRLPAVARFVSQCLLASLCVAACIPVSVLNAALRPGPHQIVASFRAARCGLTSAEIVSGPPRKARLICCMPKVKFKR
jgi:hypothetical protein